MQYFSPLSHLVRDMTVLYMICDFVLQVKRTDFRFNWTLAEESFFFFFSSGCVGDLVVVITFRVYKL